MTRRPPPSFPRRRRPHEAAPRRGRHFACVCGEGAPPFREGAAAMSRGSAASWGARVAAGCDEDCDSDDDCWDIGVPRDEAQVG